jgi:hypothetical protein
LLLKKKLGELNFYFYFASKGCSTLTGVPNYPHFPYLETALFRPVVVVVVGMAFLADIVLPVVVVVHFQIAVGAQMGTQNLKDIAKTDCGKKQNSAYPGHTSETVRVKPECVISKKSQLKVYRLHHSLSQVAP